MDIKLQKIYELDFTQMKDKLMDCEYGEGWSKEITDEVELWYKRFLYLATKYDCIIPNHEIDTFWHYHILDTKKYLEDCNNALGFFLHHYPYFGLKDDQEKQELEKSFNVTKKLFLDEFGEEIPSFTASHCYSQPLKVNKHSLEAATCSGSYPPPPPPLPPMPPAPMPCRKWS